MDTGTLKVEPVDGKIINKMGTKGKSATGKRIRKKAD